MKLVTLLALCVLLTGAHGAALDVHQVTLLDLADWLVTDSPALPDSNAPWQPQPLPDGFATLRHSGSPFGPRPEGLAAPQHWYRFNIRLNDPLPNSLALYVPRLEDRVTLFVNGQEVHRSFLRPDSIDHHWNIPLWAVIPGFALQAGDNELLFRLDSPYTGPVLMSRLRVGSPSLLHPLYQQAYFWRISAAEISTWMLAALGLFGLGVFLVRRREVVHLYLGLGALAFAVRQLHYLMKEPLISADFHWWVAVASMPWACLFLFLFTFRYYRVRYPRLEQLLLAATLTITVAIFPGLGWSAYDHGALIYTLILPVTGIAGGLILLRAWQIRRAPQLLLALGFVVNIAIGANDLMVMTRITSIEHPFLMPIGAAVLFLCFFLALAADYVEALKRVELLNQSLEERIRERQQALEDSFRELQQLEQQQALTEERQRLMREIHDGIGSNLVTTLASVQNRELTTTQTIQALSNAIADLKLTVDSLEPVEGDLPSLLGNLRYRMMPQLKTAGVDMVWEVTTLPSLDWLQAPQALHVLRIAQEAFSNILQHAEASRVTVATGTGEMAPQRPAVWIRITDNGKGFHQAPVTGKGVGNMIWRARSLGGDLTVHSPDHGGCEILLWLPLDNTLAD